MKRIEILLLPIFLLYVLVTLFLAEPTPVGDEPRHIEYAENLLAGSYTDPGNPRLECGPGYPMILVPFLALGLPLLWAKLLNGLLVYIGLIYFYRTLTRFVPSRAAFLATCLMGIYPPLIRWSIVLYSEPLSFFLLCGFCFHFVCLYQQAEFDWKHYLLAAFYLGYISQTKVIFANVLLVSLVLTSIYFVFTKHFRDLRAPLVMLGGFVGFLPFLIYTYSLTGKYFYTGTHGGQILYFRTTPYNDEWGNYFTADDVFGKDPANVIRKGYGDLDALYEHHAAFFTKIKGLSYVQQDSAFKAQAAINLREYPGKYLTNTLANMVRLPFHFPFSHRPESLRALGYMLPNMFIVVLLIFGIYPIIKRWRKIPLELKLFVGFSLIYLGGMLVAVGRGRHFILGVPSLMMLLAYVYSRLLVIKLVKSEAPVAAPAVEPDYSRKFKDSLESIEPT